MDSRSIEARLEALGERLNPVLVKELRAALRGRYFRSAFAVLLSLATVASVGFMILSSPACGSNQGSVYFVLLAASMSIGLHVLVPFSAMLSMTAESDEHTLELLQLSGLGASRIVLGKLFSTLVQALLVFSAFLPSLPFSTIAVFKPSCDARIAATYPPVPPPKMTKSYSSANSFPPLFSLNTYLVY